MSITKRIKDNIIKILLGDKVVPKGLSELNQYFRIYGPIHFKHDKEEDCYIAVSKDFRFGSIVASGRSLEDLDKNIKDSILTAFDVPSSYEKEARIKRVGEKQSDYAFA